MAWEVSVQQPPIGRNYVARVNKPAGYEPYELVIGTNYFELSYRAALNQPASTDYWDLGIERQPGTYFTIQTWSAVLAATQKQHGPPLPQVQDGTPGGQPAPPNPKPVKRIKVKKGKGNQGVVLFTRKTGAKSKATKSPSKKVKQSPAKKGRS